MDPPDLPGFYYDREKRRYFKIQPDHRLPAEAKYSTSAVRREQIETGKRMREEEHQNRIRALTVRRSDILAHPGAWRLMLETRGLRADRSTRAKAISSGLEPSIFMNLRESCSATVREPAVRNFDYDAKSRTLMTGVDDQEDHMLLGTFVQLNPRTGLAVHDIRHRISKTLTSTISSVHIAPCRQLLFTTRGSSVPAEAQIAPLRTDPDTDRVYLGCAVKLQPSSHTTIFTSAPNPFVSNPGIMAMGTLGSVIRLEYGLFGSNVAIAYASKTQAGLDAALSLEWLTANTLSAGFRSGAISIYDTRRRGFSTRLKHLSSAIGIRRGSNESQLVVAGLRSTLCLYDLRMIAEYETTKPVFKFKDYDNPYTEASGLDVHRSSGLVAAAQQNGYVQLYSLQDGSKIRCLRAPTYNPLSRSRVSFLKFIEETHGMDRGRTKLLGSIDSQVIQFD